MKHVEPLPALLVDRYRAWRSRVFEDDRRSGASLAAGQAPEIMIIACCDSRVMISDMFAAEAGDYFIHRNIGALVPPDTLLGAQGTLSTIEYAVEALAIRRILVIGHTGCGGIAGAHDLCEGRAGRFTEPGSYVGAWLLAICPAWEAVRGISDRSARLAALERETVRLSLRNLVGLPFVAAAAAAGRLSLHGALWDIARQRLDVLDPRSGRFEPITL
jgi:carbonic anhydrase